MPVDWIVAPCLDAWLGQVNAYAPRRSKRSDGSIGDPRHSALDSDHNPRKFPFSTRRIVTARDFTDDPTGGFSAQWFCRELAKLRDPRVKYVIYDWKIWYPSSGWGNYHGQNGHRTHCHVSVVGTSALMNRAGLMIPGLRPKSGQSASPSIPTSASRRNLSEGDTGPDVWTMQDLLNRMYPGVEKIPRLDPPRFGPQTKRAVQRFQKDKGLAPDGIVGPQTWSAMVKEGLR